eukprot:6188910-Pleurochrysis_carterae.AAC.2
MGDRGEVGVRGEKGEEGEDGSVRLCRQSGTGERSRLFLSDCAYCRSGLNRSIASASVSTIPSRWTWRSRMAGGLDGGAETDEDRSSDAR